MVWLVKSRCQRTYRSKSRKQGSYGRSLARLVRVSPSRWRCYCWDNYERNRKRAQGQMSQGGCGKLWDADRLNGSVLDARNSKAQSPNRGHERKFPLRADGCAPFENQRKVRQPQLWWFQLKIEGAPAPMKLKGVPAPLENQGASPLLAFLIINRPNA